MRLCTTVFVLLCATSAAADDPTIKSLSDEPTKVSVGFALTDESSKLIPVPAGAICPKFPVEISQAVGARHGIFCLLDKQTGAAGPPIFGEYRGYPNHISFAPKFALVRGATYRATAFDGVTGRVVGTKDYRVPTLAERMPTVVQSITPSGKVLPANVLRFYITFSRPMREGREVLERIKLFDDAGNEIASPWRDVELWNADATRLTLYLHPGRIKQGVNLREQLGPILLPSKRYALVVGSDLRDANGTPLGREFRHEFSTSAEVRSRIDVAAWKVAAPAVGTREPLRIEFDRPLDAALAVRLIRIRDAAGRDVVGTSQLVDGERTRLFTPAAIWKAERYVVEADPTLEDQAGNTPTRVFDTDLSAPTVDILPPQLRREFSPQ
jgi:hypothetical protein